MNVEKKEKLEEKIDEMREEQKIEFLKQKRKENVEKMEENTNDAIKGWFAQNLCDA